MTNPHGTPIWYELMTSDQDAAQKFYSDTVGWTVQESQQPGMDYRMWNADGVGIGGLMALPAEAAAMGMKPGWFAYIGVDDVDAAAAKVKTLGGAVYMEPQDIPNVGRFAFCADPQGVPFYVMRGFSDGTSTAFDPALPGRCGWNELYASDQAAAFDFYGAMFGWKQDGAMDMGPMGSYAFIGHAGGQIGAIMTAPAHSPTPHWNYYFRVPSIDAAKAKAEAGGATIFHGPMEVPTGDWVFNGVDPQGAPFSLVGRR